MPMLAEAGIEGYEMKARILHNFQAIRWTFDFIADQKAKERAARKPRK